MAVHTGYCGACPGGIRLRSQTVMAVVSSGGVDHDRRRAPGRRAADLVREVVGGMGRNQPGEVCRSPRGRATAATTRIVRHRGRFIAWRASLRACRTATVIDGQKARRTRTLLFVCTGGDRSFRIAEPRTHVVGAGEETRRNKQGKGGSGPSRHHELASELLTKISGTRPGSSRRCACGTNRCEVDFARFLMKL